MYIYKKDILNELKKHGFTQYLLIKRGIFSPGMITNIKKQKSLTLETLNKICVICKCQISDLIEIVPTDEEKVKYY